MPNGFLKFVFTLNNYTDAQYDFIVLQASVVHYLVVGKEVGESGTPHLQGFVCFKTRKSFAGVKTFLKCPTVHVEVAKAPVEAAEYCKKDGNFVEFGSLPTAGKRGDLEAFKDAVKAGTLTVKEIREAHSETYAKYTRFCLEYMNDHAPDRKMEMHQLRIWQSELNVKLNRPADDRTIMFIVDKVGNTGKSWYCDYYERMHKQVQILQPSKKADMAYALDCTSRVVFVDCPRVKSDFLQYDFLEEIKNGRVFSPKYESRVKRLEKCHVVVMMNEDPDESKLSRDRYDIVRITELNNRTVCD
jgi:Putative viral replication protein